MINHSEDLLTETLGQNEENGWNRVVMPSGPWWSRPLAQRLLLWIFIRPLYKLRGYLYMVQQATALHSPYFPYGAKNGHAQIVAHPKAWRSVIARRFAPPGWLHEYPCDDPEPHIHNEEHRGGDHCVDPDRPQVAHGLVWERNLRLGYLAGDTFYQRFGRYYTLVRPKTTSVPNPPKSSAAPDGPSGRVEAPTGLCVAPVGAQRQIEPTKDSKNEL